jgi:hypothetical protein
MVVENNNNKKFQNYKLYKIDQVKGDKEIFMRQVRDQIQNLLSLKNVCRLDHKTSIADLLSMTKSKIFVGSKHSTFSHWVSYLGQMPTVWPNGCHINKAHGKLLRGNIVETDGFVLDEKFIFECENSLNSKKNLF